MTVLLTVNGDEHELDLNGFDDETDEERQLRRAGFPVAEAPAVFLSYHHQLPLLHRFAEFHIGFMN